MCNILNVDIKEQPRIIKTSYRQRLLCCHPDKFQGANAETLKAKEEETARVITAYTFIKLHRKEKNDWNWFFSKSKEEIQPSPKLIVSEYL